MIRRVFHIGAFALMCIEGIKRDQLVVVSIEINAGVKDLLAETATDPALSHGQLGFGDAEQGVTMGAFGLHDETLAQCVNSSAFCFTFSG